MNILMLACFARNNGKSAFGGAEKSITNLANWLADKQGDNVTLVSVEGDGKPYNISENVHYEGNAVSNKGKISTHLEIYRNTKRAVEKYNPNIVVSFWIQPLFYLVLAGYGRKLKIYFSERNDPSLLYSKITKFMRWHTLKYVDGIVFQTNDAKNYFDKKIQDKSVIIHNPVYLTKQSYSLCENPDNRIVAVGRLSEQKNYKLLISAFNEIKDEHPELTVEIYGEGELREELQNEIDSCDLTDRVKLMGAFPDVLDRIYGARLFVMTSLYEGMPNALMEAMCLGIPVVCSNCPCGGPKELILDGENGFLFNNNDKIDLIKKIRLAMSSDKAISKNEREICESHSQDMIFGKWNFFIKNK